MPSHFFTLGGTRVSGFRVKRDGTVVDFEGTIRNRYSDLKRASAAARRKYGDSSITIIKAVPEKTRYRVDLNALLQIAERVD